MTITVITINALDALKPINVFHFQSSFSVDHCCLVRTHVTLEHFNKSEVL